MNEITSESSPKPILMVARGRDKIEDIKKRAALMVLEEETPVTFDFNKENYTITPEEAIDILPKAEIETMTGNLIASLELAQRESTDDLRLRNRIIAAQRAIHDRRQKPKNNKAATPKSIDIHVSSRDHIDTINNMAIVAAAIENTTVTYTHNDEKYKITPKEAEKIIDDKDGMLKMLRKAEAVKKTYKGQKVSTIKRTIDRFNKILDKLD